MIAGSSGFVVVDASVAVKWLVEEENSDVAKALVQLWADAGTRLTAPHLMPYEVSNALHRKVGAGDLAPEIATQLMQILVTHDIEFYDPSPFHADALQLATRLNQRAIYDSHYLALAQALDCEFWTADERFYRSANTHVGNVRLISEAAASNQ